MTLELRQTRWGAVLVDARQPLKEGEKIVQVFHDTPKTKKDLH